MWIFFASPARGSIKLKAILSYWKCRRHCFLHWMNGSKKLFLSRIIIACIQELLRGVYEGQNQWRQFSLGEPNLSTLTVTSRIQKRHIRNYMPIRPINIALYPVNTHDDQMYSVDTPSPAPKIAHNILSFSQERWFFKAAAFCLFLSHLILTTSRLLRVCFLIMPSFLLGMNGFFFIHELL